MKNIYKLLISLAFSLSVPIASAQDVIETPRPDISAERRDMIKKVFSFREEGLDAEQLSNTIGTLEEILKRSDNKYDRYITTFHLTFFYAQAKEYGKCLDMLKAGQDEGFFFPAITGRRTWPEYLTELKKLERFDKWSKENKRRKSEAQKNAKAEYFVQTPTGYTKEKKYPLLIVFHGGVDSNVSSYVNWQSPKLQSEYIVAHLQGERVQGSYHRSYGDQWQAAVRQTYRQIIEKYSVDTRRVLAGGASAGAMKVFTIAQDQIIPVAGAIMAFPGPCKHDEAKLKQLAKEGLRVALLTGELDGAIKIQKELGVTFDKAGLPNRFVVFPSIGHQFPEDFSNQIDLSLDFIWSQ